MMKRIQMVDLQAQYLKVEKEINEAVQEVIHSARFINGPQVEAFRSELAAYTGSAHVITCASGTDALSLALTSLDLQPGDEVITVPFTFVATAEVIAQLGLKPVFVDVCPDTFNMDVDLLETAITERTRVILPVHLFGQCADMERILAIAEKHHLFVVEDACQAIGAKVTFSDGTVHQAGTMGDVGCTSFFPSKNLGCYGDGGALFVQDDNRAQIIQELANHGMTERYYYNCIGVNSRLDAMQAAILRVKLRYLDQYTDARQCAAKAYQEALADHSKVETPTIAPFTTHVFHQFTLKLNGVNRRDLRQKMQEDEIPTAVYYPLPLHLQKAYAYLGYAPGDFPVSESLAQNVLSLPMHTELTKEQIEYIVSSLSRNI